MRSPNATRRSRHATRPRSAAPGGREGDAPTRSWPSTWPPRRICELEAARSQNTSSRPTLGHARSTRLWGSCGARRVTPRTPNARPKGSWRQPRPSATNCALGSPNSRPKACGRVPMATGCARTPRCSETSSRPRVQRWPSCRRPRPHTLSNRRLRNRLRSRSRSHRKSRSSPKSSPEIAVPEFAGADVAEPVVAETEAHPPLPLRVAGQHTPAPPLARRRPRKDSTPAPAPRRTPDATARSQRLEIPPEAPASIPSRKCRSKPIPVAEVPVEAPPAAPATRTAPPHRARRVHRPRHRGGDDFSFRRR